MELCNPKSCLASFIIHSSTSNIDDLVDAVYNKYEGGTKEEIRADCIKVLYQMETVGLITISEDLRQDKHDYICVAGEGDFKKISKFIIDNVKKTIKIELRVTAKKKIFALF